ncbi:MAG: hypothetical protein J0I77_19975 [Rudaea sp.]|uniref:hypothetical protein n=1 Tax=unclassified Rudaea TaxID=2627037 RepID=UPI0010F9B852|nr:MULTISPECIES: hypothetical protein [unclassified Rudaea]MBN8888004.1 hypothetical protein [Rudaea sp.]
MRRLLPLLLFAAAPAGANPAPHYLNVVNNSPDTLAALAARVHGGDQWTPFDVGPDRTSTVLLGGQTATLALRGGCVFDLRATFRNGRTVTVTDFNACTTATLHLEQVLRKAQ